MKLRYIRLITAVILIAAALQTIALAEWVKVSSGYEQTAQTNQDLYLRVDPSAYTEGLGTFRISGQWVTVSGRAWDDENNIWWIRCSFNYNGRYITGWTGAKRFYSNTYDLYGLPEYEERTGYSGGHGGNGGSQWKLGSSQEARANQQLALRVYPDPSTEYVGTFFVSGEWITLKAKHWDNVNNIYWVQCDFYYNGRHITGWTGSKRFDSNTYSLNSLPNG